VSGSSAERAAFLDDDWFELASRLAAGTTGGDGPELRVQHVVGGGRAEPEVRYVVVVEGGRPVSVVPGADPAADVVLTTDRAAAADLVAGRVALDTAYMQGRAKLAGDPAAVLALLRASRDPAWRSFADRLAASTDLTG
jgi:hypothetical protein